MAFTQRVKIKIMPFNPLNWDTVTHGALPAYGTGLDLIGEVNNGAGYAIGTTAITVDGFSASPGTNVAVRFENGKRAYHGNFSSATALTIDPGLEEAVVDNEDVYVLPIIDITQYCMRSPTLSYDRELGTDDFVFDKQLRFKLANFSEEFYDSDVHTTAFSFSNAYFMTYNPQDARDYAYVTIEVLRGGSWKLRYAGKIVRDDMVVNIMTKEVEFRTESLLYETQDVLFGEVPGVYDGHWYTSSTRLTKTISGKITDLIGKIGESFGLQKKGYTVTNKSKSGAVCTLTLTSPTNFKVGDLIDVNISDNHFYIKGGIVASVSGSQITYNQRITATVGSTAISVANGLYHRRINFDKPVDFFDITHQGWSYTLEDLWWITPKWRQKDVSAETAWDMLKNFLVAFAASAHLDYYDGVPRLFIRAKVPTSASVVTVDKTDFVTPEGDESDAFTIQPNHRNWSPDGVEIKSSIEYFSGGSVSHNITYNEELLAWANFDDNKGGTTLFLRDLITDTSLSSNDIIGHTLKCETHDQAYRIVEGFLGDPNPAWREAIKRYQTFYEDTDMSSEIKYPECFNIKLKFPDIYVAANTSVSGNQQGFKLYNDNSSGSITNYTRTYFSDRTTTLRRGVAVVPLLPMRAKQGVGIDLFEEIALGCNIFLLETANIYYYGEPLLLDGSTTTQTDNGGSVFIDETGNFTFTSISADYIESEDETTIDTDYFVTLIAGGTNGADGRIRRYRIGMTDSGDYWTTTDRGSNRFFKLDLNASNTRVSDASVTTIPCVYLHSNILHPDFDDKIYYGKNASPYLQNILAFGDNTINSTLTGTPVAVTPQGIMISHQYGITGQVIYFSDTTSDTIKYVTTSWSSLGTWVGGGATPPATLGSGVSASSIKLTNPRGIWVNYDNITVIGARDDDKVLIYDPTASTTVYTIADTSFGFNNPFQVQCVDFIQAFSLYTGLSAAIYHDITYSSSRKHYDFHAASRRVIRCKLLYDTIATDLIIGDVITLDNVVSAADYKFQVSSLDFDFEEQLYILELTEVGAA